MLFPVKKEWIPGLPEISYRNGTGKWEGVVMHYTDTPNDSAESERAWEVVHYPEAFVHEFIDPNVILQVASPEYIAYGAGFVANQRFVHLELCSANNQADFEQSYQMWCAEAARFLFEQNLDVSLAKADGSGTLWSHYDVTQYLGNTTHVDPIAYLQKWGKTWQDVFLQVQNYYNELKKGAGGQMTPEDANKMITTFLSPLWSFVSKQEDKDEIHRLANELRKASGQPEQ